MLPCPTQSRLWLPDELPWYSIVEMTSSFCLLTDSDSLGSVADGFRPSGHAALVWPMAKEDTPASRRGKQGMKTGADTGERRREQRFRFSLSVLVQGLSPTQEIPLAAATARGVIHDISKSGIGLSTVTPLTYSAVVRCDVAVADLPISIPTMAQVRWVKRAHGGEYRSGLAYIL